MLMTKEALKENHASYIKGFNEAQDTIETAVGICTIATIIILVVAVLVSILKHTTTHVMIGIGIVTVIWMGFGLLIIATGINEKKDGLDVEYKINTIMPYLFKNEETADTLKRFDKVNIQIDQNELLNTGIIKGQVVVDDNGKEVIYPFKQITLGVTSGTASYLEVNMMDVELNEDYPKGKVFNVLYLNEIDYTTLMNLFGEIPIRIEK
ncbi:hypothetical protein ACOMCU_00900 [Lysinibacillus sp. UGB7]|uniref:hypothetical protein n=1 Tax=Lysinibacillus sp. UGB7 TaxID=3411039 RepID=UPI003B7F218D